MTQGDMVLSIVKLVLGGISAFCAIMLWSKTRDAAWMSLAAGVVTETAREKKRKKPENITLQTIAQYVTKLHKIYSPGVYQSSFIG